MVRGIRLKAIASPPPFWYFWSGTMWLECALGFGTQSAMTIFPQNPNHAVMIHTVFEMAAYAIGFQIWRRTRRSLETTATASTSPTESISPVETATNHSLNKINLLWILCGAILGAAIGSKVAFWMEHPIHAFADFPNLIRLMEGKSIVGGLLGGVIGVEFAKARMGITRSTGDTMVLPVIVGMCIGRLGCFFAGLTDKTYGVATHLSWGIDFGDGVARHPTQLYEIAFLFGVAILLTRHRARLCAFANTQTPTLARTGLLKLERMLAREGDQFRLFMVLYLSFRLLIESIKPMPFAYLGLISGIQVLCILGLMYYGRDLLRWVKGNP